MESLLEKSHSLKSLLKASKDTPDFPNMVQVISQNIQVNVYIIGRRGKILGYHLWDEYSCSNMQQVLYFSERFPESYNQKLISILETEKNITDTENSCIFSPHECPLLERYVTVIPIYGWGERFATIVLASAAKKITDEAIVLAELGAMVVAMGVMLLKLKRAENDDRNTANVQIALKTLSFSELRAVEHILNELDGMEGLVVASRVADRVGITRSVIVNALRKLESANVIQAKSLGMKGTFIRILNNNLIDELNNMGWLKKKTTINDK
jgi:transcriptional pleiotropic repressor